MQIAARVGFLRAGLLYAAALVLVLLIHAGAAQAGGYTWSGEGAAGSEGDRWSNPENWSGHEAPSGSVGTLLFPKLTATGCESGPRMLACYEAIDDLAGLSAEGLVFDGNYTVGGLSYTTEEEREEEEEIVVVKEQHEGEGQAITLGEEGLEATDSNTILKLPLNLEGAQVWHASSGSVYLGGPVSSESALEVSLAHGGRLELADNTETGPLTFKGAESEEAGSNASENGTVFDGGERPGAAEANINGTNQNPVTIDDVELSTSSRAEGPTTIGPLTVIGGSVDVEDGEESGELKVNGAMSLDSASVLALHLYGPYPGPPTATHVAASGEVNLGGAELALNLSALGCSQLEAGTVFTLVSAQGGVSGTFAGLPPGTVTVARCGGSYALLKINYEADAVTGTVVAEGGRPVIARISTKKGSPSGGEHITITGENFSGVTAVRFGGVEATSFTVESGTSISAVDPPGTSGSAPVTVETPAGPNQKTTKANFKYGNPTVAGVSPNSGPTSGGTPITIHGAGFAVGSSTKIEVGKVFATSVSCATSSECTAITPAARNGDPGGVEVAATAGSVKSKRSGVEQFDYVN